MQFSQITDWDEISSYFSELLKQKNYEGIEIKVCGDGDRGKGVFATKDFKKGEVIFEEAPLVGIQHAKNRAQVEVCQHCFKFVGSIEAQIGRCILSNIQLMQAEEQIQDEELLDRFEITTTQIMELLENRTSVPGSDQYHLPTKVWCKGGCNEIYCSTQCRDAAWNNYHCLLCMGLNQCEMPDCIGDYFKTHQIDRSALADFQDFCKTTNDCLYLSAVVTANVILTTCRILWEQGSLSITDAQQQAWLPYGVAHQKLWWQSVAVPDDAASEQQFRSELRSLCETSQNLLERSWGAQFAFTDLLQLEVFGRIVGIFDLNNLSINIEGPVNGYLVQHEAEMPELQTALEECEFQCEGTGFYKIQSCCNHSCVPNAQCKRGVGTIEENIYVQFIATNDIKSGEEVLVSYLDEGLDYAERQKQLQDYGFVCGCSLCQAQRHS